MKYNTIPLVLLVAVYFIACDSKSSKKPITPKTNVATKAPQVKSTPKKVIKKDPQYSLTDSKIEYRTTAYDCRLLPNPDSNSEITRVPPDTKLKVLDKRTVQQGRMKNNWYKVNYDGKTGWISGWNMKEGEELIVTTVEEMERNYAKDIGEKPSNNSLTGKIDILVDWLKKNAHDPKSIEYIQWYEPYFLNGSWNCRVEFRAKNTLGNFVKEDKIFKVKNSGVVEVIDKF